MPLTAYGAVYDVCLREGYGGQVKRTPDIGVQVFGRLLPDVRLAEAEAQLNGVAAMPSADAPASKSARGETGYPPGRASASDALAITVLVSAVIGYTALHAIAAVRKPGVGDNDPAPEGSGTMSSLELVTKLSAAGGNLNVRMTKRANLTNTR